MNWFQLGASNSVLKQDEAASVTLEIGFESRTTSELVWFEVLGSKRRQNLDRRAKGEGKISK